jgi:hypothetical protein
LGPSVSLSFSLSVLVRRVMAGWFRGPVSSTGGAGGVYECGGVWWGGDTRMLRGPFPRAWEGVPGAVKGPSPDVEGEGGERLLHH